MKGLPLYPTAPRAAVQDEVPLALDKGCRRCKLHEKAQSVCLGADGQPGGLLVVGEAPNGSEDRMGRPFTGLGGKLLRTTIAKYWDGPVVLDNAVRCFPGEKGPTPKAVASCRPFLAQTLHEARPTRIITVGAWAALAVLGRTSAPFSNRRAYAYLPVAGGPPVPVFFVLHPMTALRNRFVRQWFDEDMKWALTAKPEMPPWEGYAYVIETPGEAERAIAEVRRRRFGTFDVETAGNFYDPSFRLLSLAVCAEGDRDAYVWSEEALKDPAIVAPLRAWLADPDAAKSGANVKFDMAVWAYVYGEMPRGVTKDTRLWRKLLEPETEANLARMSELVGMGGMKEEAAAHSTRAADPIKKLLQQERRLAKKGTPSTYSLVAEFGVTPAMETCIRSGVDSMRWALAFVPKKVLHRYNARDAVATCALTERLEPELDAAPSLRRLWDTVIMGASEAIAQVEAWGVGTDKDAVSRLDQYLAVRQQDLREQLSGFEPSRKPGEEPFNWGSNEQLADLLFHRYRLPVIRLTDTGAESTARDVLEELRDRHACVGLLIDYRKVCKLRGTYASGLLPHVRPDGRIHPTILLDGARSGRTSCQDPNLQNQPRPETPEAKMVRDLFVAEPGNELVQLDYSQLELRVAAMLSGDPRMLDIFNEGVDYHMRTAQLISKVAWGIPPEAVEKKHRSFAKTINFGLLYGKGDKTIAEEFGCTIEQAATIRAAILGQFRRLATWCDLRVQEARRTGRVWTWWAGEPARWRPLWRVADADDYARSVAEHGAVNSPVQGTASEFCIASLVESVRFIKAERLNARLVLPVHDALLFEVAKADAPRLAQGVRRIMESWPANGVPLVVDCERGPAWGSLEKWDGQAAQVAA